METTTTNDSLSASELMLLHIMELVHIENPTEAKNTETSLMIEKISEEIPLYGNEKWKKQNASDRTINDVNKSLFFIF